MAIGDPPWPYNFFAQPRCCCHCPCCHMIGPGLWPPPKPFSAEQPQLTPELQAAVEAFVADLAKRAASKPPEGA